MEHRYKAALRSLYKNKLSKQVSSDYADHLFPVGWSYAEPNPKPTQKAPVAAEAKVVEPVQSKEVDASTDTPKAEKTQVIESLNEFTRNLMEEAGADKVALGNIEISKKTTSSSFEAGKNLSGGELESLLIDRIGQERVNLRYKSIDGLNRFNLDKVKAIFVADTLISKPFEGENKELSEFFALFDEQTALLFSKMVKAMKLDHSEYLLTAITDEDNEQEKGNHVDMVLKEIATFKPDLVITLGVSASHALLESKQRLKDLHGNFYGLTIGDFKTEVMPLFSPSLLKSAPHMKSITWVDMQKAMEKLA